MKLIIMKRSESDKGKESEAYLVWIALQASCEGFTGSVLIEGKLALNSLSKVLCDES